MQYMYHIKCFVTYVTVLNFNCMCIKCFFNLFTVSFQFRILRWPLPPPCLLSWSCRPCASRLPAVRPQHRPPHTAASKESERKREAFAPSRSLQHPAAAGPRTPTWVSQGRTLMFDGSLYVLLGPALWGSDLIWTAHADIFGLSWQQRFQNIDRPINNRCDSLILMQVDSVLLKFVVERGRARSLSHSVWCNIFFIWGIVWFIWIVL